MQLIELLPHLGGDRLTHAASEAARAADTGHERVRVGLVRRQPVADVDRELCTLAHQRRPEISIARVELEVTRDVDETRDGDRALDIARHPEEAVGDAPPQYVIPQVPPAPTPAST